MKRKMMIVSVVGTVNDVLYKIRTDGVSMCNVYTFRDAEIDRIKNEKTGEIDIKKLKQYVIKDLEIEFDKYYTEADFNHVFVNSYKIQKISDSGHELIIVAFDDINRDRY